MCEWIIHLQKVGIMLCLLKRNQTRPLILSSSHRYRVTWTLCMCKQNKFVVTQLWHLVVEIPKRGSPGVDLHYAFIKGKLMEITDCWLFKICTDKLRAGGADIYIRNWIKIHILAHFPLWCKRYHLATFPLFPPNILILFGLLDLFKNIWRKMWNIFLHMLFILFFYGYMTSWVNLRK